MRPEDQFHTGVVVHDFEATLTRLSELVGYRWCDPIVAPTQVQTPAGEKTVEFHMTYSRDEPRVEIVSAVEGTLWEPAAGSGIHHLGYWSDDLDTDSTALEQSGFAFEAKGITPDGNPFWAYHRHPAGPRIEVVSRTLEPMLARWWAGR